jgi:hypothetical protein
MLGLRTARESWHPDYLLRSHQLESGKNGYIPVGIKYGEQGKIRHTKYDNLMYIDQTFPR